MQNRILSDQLNHKIGEKVTIAGWVNSRRDHGKLIFVDIKDRKGLVQVVFLPGSEAHKKAEEIRSQWVVQVTGEIVERPENMRNSEIVSGNIELRAEHLEVVSQATNLPFETDDTKNVSEDIRLKYRYIDLRSPRMQNNIITRSNVITQMRRWLIERDFIEIETPNLTRSTPEGARDYIVPSRLQPGAFYALPQSPQQYKQLLMISGFERYFQIARCFRDEDTRGDRQPEFTQLDLEMAFVEREDIIDLIENLYIDVIKQLFPEKKITQKPFPKLSYKEAMEQYKTDRPDLRKNTKDQNELAFAWVIDFPMFEKDERENKWTYAHNPFSAPKPEYQDTFEQYPEQAISQQYDLALNGFEIAGGSIRNTDPKIQQRVFEFLGHDPGRVRDKFGHLLDAYQYGAPQHGGIALGLDRFFAVIQNEPNIREVIAFPKTGDGRDLLMNAPSTVDQNQLNELGISVSVRKK